MINGKSVQTALISSLRMLSRFPKLEHGKGNQAGESHKPCTFKLQLLFCLLPFSR